MVPAHWIGSRRHPLGLDHLRQLADEEQASAAGRSAMPVGDGAVPFDEPLQDVASFRRMQADLTREDVYMPASVCSEEVAEVGGCQPHGHLSADDGEIVDTYSADKLPDVTKLQQVDDRSEAYDGCDWHVLDRTPSVAAPSSSSASVDEEQRRFDREVQRSNAAREAREARDKVRAFLVQHGCRHVRARTLRTTLTKTYPLHCAVSLNDADMVSMLLRVKADPTQVNSWGQTPLQYAQRKLGRSHSSNTLLDLLESVSSGVEHLRSEDTIISPSTS
eukprot:SRR837773.16165.p1 GENE.SRR837773.16165~~SRR837773.16165.p1  ORF type:complete len:288 (-),score=6.20 SRR837773.16165:36-863(-)